MGLWEFLQGIPQDIGNGFNAATHAVSSMGNSSGQTSRWGGPNINLPFASIQHQDGAGWVPQVDGPIPGNTRGARTYAPDPSSFGSEPINAQTLDYLKANPLGSKTSATQAAVAATPPPTTPPVVPATPMTEAQHNIILRDSILQDLRGAKNPYDQSVLQGMVQSAYGGAADQYNGGERAIMDNAASRGVSGGISADEANYRAQMGKAEGDANLGAQERFAAGASGWDQNNRGLINQASQSDIGGAQLSEIAGRAQQAGQFATNNATANRAIDQNQGAGIVQGAVTAAGSIPGLVSSGMGIYNAITGAGNTAGAPQPNGTPAGFQTPVISNTGAAPAASSSPGYANPTYTGSPIPATPGPAPIGMNGPGQPYGPVQYHTQSVQSPSPLYNTLYPQAPAPTNAGSAPTGNGAGTPQGGGIPRLQSKFPNYRMGG